MKHLTLPDPSHPAVRTLIARILSPHVHTITFEFNLYSLKKVADTEPELLMRTLTGHNLANLREVRFAISWEPKSVEGVEEAFEKAYADLHGMLRVQRRSHVHWW